MAGIRKSDGLDASRRIRHFQHGNGIIVRPFQFGQAVQFAFRIAAPVDLHAGKAIGRMYRDRFQRFEGFDDDVRDLFLKKDAVTLHFRPPCPSSGYISGCALGKTGPE